MITQASSKRGRSRPNGFALVVSLMLMTLLAVVAVGLLSLGSISLRSSLGPEPRRIAQANARVALALAIGEIQKQLGDDRRITADASVLGESTPQGHVVGVWDSVAGNHTAAPLDRAPDYAAWKNDKFRRWLVSHPEPQTVARRNWGRLIAPADGARLFSSEMDGFEILAPRIPVSSRESHDGTMSWAVSQEGTKAGVAVGGDRPRQAANDSIQAPKRPHLGLSKLLDHPEDGWGLRAARVTNLSQAVLDGSFGSKAGPAAGLGSDYAVSPKAVLADVVKGGLKTDLSLAFELAESEFNAPRWGDIDNPFSGGSAPGREVPLFTPLNGGGPISLTGSYGVINHTQVFDTGAPPTFNTLRSYYRLYRHLYESGDQVTAFQRAPASRYWTSPGQTAPRGGETAVNPVLDRVLFFLSVWADREGVINLVVTPVITLWNPYNVALECEGFVAYPWMDFPINVSWNVQTAGGSTVSGRSWISLFVGSGDTGEGRSTKPYFFCELTGDGSGKTNPPLRLGPGEVRVFTPVSKTPRVFEKTAPDFVRTVRMRPVTELGQLNLEGGLAIRMTDGLSPGANFNHRMQPGDRLDAKVEFTRSDHHYYVTLEDAGRITGRTPKVVSEVQVYKGKATNQSFQSPSFTQASLRTKPQPVGVLETFHRTAGTPGQLSDLVYTVNPRQRYVNALVSGSNFPAGPHYESSLRQVADFHSAIQVSLDAQRSYYGFSNSSAPSGRDYLSFFELPRDPMLSLGGFQNADLADSAFSPASQAGNSWASPYLSRSNVGRLLRNATTSGGEVFKPSGLGIYDHSYLLNQALWDGYFFSSLSPEFNHRSATGSPAVYDAPQIRESRTLTRVINDWLQDPAARPLRNPRLMLHRGGIDSGEIADRLTSPAGCRKVAGHLLLEGAFNVNSTSEAAWQAMLASLRGHALDVRTSYGGSYSHNSGIATPVPRLRQPMGSPGDPWNGFRELSDDDIVRLAREIVVEVRSRGPFQSLGEFVNRRMSVDALGLKGALQAAIDRAGLNHTARIQRFDTTGYPFRSNIGEADTGVGTPGWLTQADLLNALGPVITVRSDTFTVRACGEALDDAGKVVATAWCEAVVQRVPEWIDPGDPATDAPADLTPPSARFGRRFEVLSFREISREEIGT